MKKGESPAIANWILAEITRRGLTVTQFAKMAEAQGEPRAVGFQEIEDELLHGVPDIDHFEISLDLIAAAGVVFDLAYEEVIARAEQEFAHLIPG